MQQIVENLETLVVLINGTVSTLGVYNIVMGIITVFSLWIGSRAIQKRKPCFAITTTNFLMANGAEKIDSLEVKYHEKKVDDVSVSYIALWNNGTLTINKEDFAPQAKLAVAPVAGVDILEAEIVYIYNKINNFKLSYEKGKIKINFDYFDYKEGVVLRIVHTGISSDDLNLIGTLKQGGPIRNVRGKLKLLSNTLDNFVGPIKATSVIETYVVYILLLTLPLIPLIEIIFPALNNPSMKFSLITSGITALISWPVLFLFYSSKVPYRYLQYLN